MVVIVVSVAVSVPFASPTMAQGDRLQVAVSTPILADILRNVAGDQVEVFSVMPGDADPHTWEASPQDIVAATEADSFIFIGAHLEPFVETGGWRRAVEDAGIPQLVVSEHVELIERDLVIDHGDHVHDLRAGDPHIWLDPLKMVEAIPAIVAHLTEIDPDGTAGYTENGAAYIAELEALHAELEESFAAIPLERRVLVVFHDAYTYFAARYGFEVVGVVIENPEVEISAGEVVDLMQVIEGHDIDVIFAEPQFNTGVLDIFVSESGVEVGELLTDAFAGRADSYVDLMRFNRDCLVRHLG
jgi:zinc/manganese transport system substrate-binding protein/manganese/iron transport system substrate-binding protein